MVKNVAVPPVCFGDVCGWGGKLVVRDLEYFY